MITIDRMIAYLFESAVDSAFLIRTPSVNFAEGSKIMATNPPKGDGHRNGAVKGRSQTKTTSGHYVKRDSSSGRFMDVKTSSKKPFKGITKEK